MQYLQCRNLKRQLPHESRWAQAIWSHHPSLLSQETQPRQDSSLKKGRYQHLSFHQLTLLLASASVPSPLGVERFLQHRREGGEGRKVGKKLCLKKKLQVGFILLGWPWHKANGFSCFPFNGYVWPSSSSVQIFSQQSSGHISISIAVRFTQGLTV